MDLQSTQAALQYHALKPVTAPQGQAGSTGPGTFAGDFAAMLQSGEETAKAAMTGEASPHALVEALAQTELAVEAAVTIRDRVVEAYQEILRMPV